MMTAWSFTRWSLVSGVVVGLVTPTLAQTSRPATSLPASLPSSQPSSQPTSRPDAAAGRLFGEGVRLFQNKSYTEALESFKKAYKIAPNYRVLYNIGSTTLLLGDYAAALYTFRRYLAIGGPKVSSARRQLVQTYLQRLTKRVAWLRITTDTAGAQVRIDGKQIGRTPIPKPLAVNPGQHEVVASRGSGPSASQQISLASGEQRSLHLVITRYDTASSRPVKPLAAASRSYTRVWISAGVTGALTAATVVMGVLALQAESDLKDETVTFPASPSAIEAARDRTKSYSLAADLLLAGSIVAAGLSAYFLIAERRRSDEADDRTALQVTPGAVSLRTVF